LTGPQREVLEFLGMGARSSTDMKGRFGSPMPQALSDLIELGFAFAEMIEMPSTGDAAGARQSPESSGPWYRLTDDGILEL
jgi:hypothetical protein